MINKFLTRFAVVASILFIVGSSLGLGTFSSIQKAEAAGCASPSIMFGRWKWCGYFYNKFQDYGDGVRERVSPPLNGMPGNVDTAQEFIDLVKSDLWSGDEQRYTGAIFIIDTMIGAPPPWPALPAGSIKPITWEQLGDFENRVKGYVNVSENGSRSTGSNGTIDWWVSQHTNCGEFNSYYQTVQHDVAPYVDTASNSHCSDPNYRSDFVIFRDRSGNQVYMLRRACFNPMGVLNALSNEPLQNYSLTPSVGVQVSSGGSPIAGNTAEPGDSVTFTYSVNNSGPTVAAGVGCSIYANSHTGYYNASNPAPKGSAAAVATGCPRDWPVSNTVINTETVNNLPANSTICRSLYVDHATYNGPESGTEACVIVASKPYMRVYGGDVSAGNGFTVSGTCVNNTLGAVVGWNKEGSGGFAGAGAQFATLAMNQIYDFATALGNTTATNGSRLAFANTSTGGGKFGGSFGSLPCIPDYYGNKPSSATAYTGTPLSTLNNAAYTATGPITISGNINPGQRSALYVQGDVIIDGNIVYPGSWQLNTVPLFELIVKGNIYISKNVTRLDGLYVAQQNGSSGGVIYTCTNGSTPVATTALAGNCSNKLTVNGAFVAHSVQLLRTAGTLTQSSAGETGTSGRAAEVFNYSPLMWIVSPPQQNGGDTYDSITSLPPIL